MATVKYATLCGSKKSLDYGFSIRGRDGKLELLDARDPHSRVRIYRTLAKAAEWATLHGNEHTDIVERKRVDGEWIELATYVFRGTDLSGLFKYEKLED